jgi:Flp pilus assembly protein TadB
MSAGVELTPIPNNVLQAAIIGSQTGDGGQMGILRAIGIVLIVVWLVLWLFVKITLVAIHLLLLLGIATIVIDLARSRSKGNS